MEAGVLPSAPPTPQAPPPLANDEDPVGPLWEHASCAFRCRKRAELPAFALRPEQPSDPFRGGWMDPPRVVRQTPTATEALRWKFVVAPAHVFGTLVENICSAAGRGRRLSRARNNAAVLSRPSRGGLPKAPEKFRGGPDLSVEVLEISAFMLPHTTSLWMLEGGGEHPTSTPTPLPHHKCPRLKKGRRNLPTPGPSSA